MEVYLLWHDHDFDAEVEVKLLGVYSSEQKAEDARLRVSNEPGFREHPDGFQISRYEVDKNRWTEGFETVRW
jgi:hypothetical protein